MPRRCAVLPAILLILFASSILGSCGTAPKTSLSQIPDGPQLAAVDDTLYADVLDRCVSPNGAVSFSHLHGDSDLTEYLGEIARVRISAFTSRAEVLALWINAHNAAVLDVVRSNMPVHSIDDIPGFRYAKVVIVDGVKYTLNDIEHSVLTRQFREPRAFFALYDGSRSSPRLQSTPYSSERLSDELDAQVRSFLADSTKNYLDRKTNTLYLSKLFEDYSSQLEQTAGSVRAFVRAFAPPELAEWMDGHSQMKIAFLSYDPTLNTSDVEAPHERPQPRPRKKTGGIE